MKTEMDYLDHYGRPSIIDVWTELTLPQRYVHDRIFECIINEIDLIPGEKILDAGCGDGLLIKKLFDSGRTANIGMDISFPAISKLKNRLFQNHLAGSLFQGDVRLLPLKEDSIGCVISKETLEHLMDNDLKMTLNECYHLI